MAGPRASEETVEMLRHELGMDRPILVQYADYMSHFFRGDFGKSLRYPDKTVAELIVPRMTISYPLGVAAIFVAGIIGTLVGLVASFWRGRWLDNLLMSNALFFSAIPSMVLIQFLILIFAIKLHWLPAGWTGDWKSVFSLNAVIPILTLSLISIAGFARLVRTTTLAVFDEPYVRTAYAKGLPTRVIAFKYILRPALLPLITVVLPAFFTFVEGAFFVETIYSIPGMGVFTIESIFARDYPTIVTIMTFSAFFFVVATLVVDISYRFFDPRVNIAR
jgi:ABC-type dipeptide/oligopeptide/nickel transport system permease component